MSFGFEIRVCRGATDSSQLIRVEGLLFHNLMSRLSWDAASVLPHHLASFHFTEDPRLRLELWLVNTHHSSSVPLYTQFGLSHIAAILPRLARGRVPHTLSVSIHAPLSTASISLMKLMIYGTSFQRVYLLLS